MLKEPRSEDICSNFGENTTFLLVLLSIRIIVFFPRAFTTADARVTRIAWNKQTDRINKQSNLLKKIK